MKMTEQEYKEHELDNSGYCTRCDAITTSEVEPDAEGYTCPECQNESVMGIENALVYEHIEISEEDDEDIEDNIISFSDED